MASLSKSFLVFCGWLILLQIACKKSDIGIGNGTIQADRDLNMIWIGNHIVRWPTNEYSFYMEMVTDGEGKYQVKDSIPFSWRLISGPNTPIIKMESGYSDKSKRFKMSDLKIGVYEMEVSFDEKYGIKYNKDTGRIIVDNLSDPPNEYIFSAQNWVIMGSMYQSSKMEIADVYKKIPPESAFRVLVKTNTGWEELPWGYSTPVGGLYSYTFDYIKENLPNSKSLLTIWSDAVEYGKADIKLLY